MGKTRGGGDVKTTLAAMKLLSRYRRTATPMRRAGELYDICVVLGRNLSRRRRTGVPVV